MARVTGTLSNLLFVYFIDMQACPGGFVYPCKRGYKQRMYVDKHLCIIAKNQT